jgi:hypothetical protein
MMMMKKLRIMNSSSHHSRGKQSEARVIFHAVFTYFLCFALTRSRVEHSKSFVPKLQRKQLAQFKDNIFQFNFPEVDEK